MSDDISEPRIRKRSGPKPNPDLSPRQLQIVKLLSKGLQRGQIAYELGLGMGTIKIHMTKLRQKMHAKTTAEAVATATKQGLIE